MQKEIAGRLGVHLETVKNWECGRTSPGLRQIPKIIEFLGYDPESEPKSLRKRIAYYRRQRGMTQEELAETFGVNPTTIYRWENRVIEGKLRQRINKLLDPKTTSIPQ